MTRQEISFKRTNKILKQQHVLHGLYEQKFYPNFQVRNKIKVIKDNKVDVNDVITTTKLNFLNTIQTEPDFHSSNFMASSSTKKINYLYFQNSAATKGSDISILRSNSLSNLTFSNMLYEILKKKCL